MTYKPAFPELTTPEKTSKKDDYNAIGELIGELITGHASPKALARTIRYAAPDTRPEQVLEWVNEQRAEIGLRSISALPPGKMARPEACVVARSFPRGSEANGGSVSISYRTKYLRLKKHKTVLAPAFVREFIGLFDVGFYPRLVEKQF